MIDQMDYELDDPHAEAAAARHAPNKPSRPRPPNLGDDAVLLRIRIDRETYNEMLEVKPEDRGVEGFIRRLIKREIHQQQQVRAGFICG
jgi:hypothetical protein